MVVVHYGSFFDIQIIEDKTHW